MQRSHGAFATRVARNTWPCMQTQMPGVEQRVCGAQKKLDSLIDRGAIRSSDLDNRTMDSLEGALPLDET